VKTARRLGALILFSYAVVSPAQEIADEDFHPSDSQLKTMEQACAVNETGIVSLGEKLNAAIADWRKATAGAGPGSATRQLDGFLDEVRNHGALSGKKTIYVLCVEKAVRQFIETRREKPQPLADSGSSQLLQRASFASEDDIWRHGCQQAESDALLKLQKRCGDRTFVETNSDCAQLSGSTRTYKVEVSGECRAK
jgi:hypothetical protein